MNLCLFNACQVKMTRILRHIVGCRRNPCIFDDPVHTFLIVMMPNMLVGSVVMSKVSLPSPSMMLYTISALGPTSRSLAQMRPTTEPTCTDSGTLIWYSPERNR